MTSDQGQKVLRDYQSNHGSDTKTASSRQA